MDTSATGSGLFLIQFMSLIEARDEDRARSLVVVLAVFARLVRRSTAASLTVSVAFVRRAPGLNRA
jgi:hypothetical protein